MQAVWRKEHRPGWTGRRSPGDLTWLCLGPKAIYYVLCRVESRRVAPAEGFAVGQAFPTGKVYYVQGLAAQLAMCLFGPTDTADPSTCYSSVPWLPGLLGCSYIPRYVPPGQSWQC